jgi:hypothetical protein
VNAHELKVSSPGQTAVYSPKNIVMEARNTLFGAEMALRIIVRDLVFYRDRCRSLSVTSERRGHPVRILARNLKETASTSPFTEDIRYRGKTETRTRRLRSRQHLPALQHHQFPRRRPLRLVSACLEFCGRVLASISGFTTRRLQSRHAIGGPF